MKQLSILGLGLMGGSLGLAARRRGLADRIRGYARREETRRLAAACGAVDEVFADPAEAVRGADVCVLCVPVLVIPELARACRPGLGAETLVTDVGSTKAVLSKDVRRAIDGTGAVFVGSHPIAGSDETGIEAARADLYEGALTVVTPAAETDAGAVTAVSDMWRGLGATVRVCSPEAHDAVIARTSHLPHLAAVGLVHTVLGGGGEDVGAFCGTGFGDTTRVAGGSEDVWHDIVKTNAEAVAGALADYRDEIERVMDFVQRRDFEGLREWLKEGRDARRAWRRRMP